MHPLKILPKTKPVNSNQSISQGTEFVGTLVVFLLIGLGLDAWLGTMPVFTIALSVFSLIGQFVKTYYSYSSAMRHLEQERASKARGGDR